MRRARVVRRLAEMTAFTEVHLEDAFVHAGAVVMPLTLQVGTAVGTATSAMTPSVTSIAVVWATVAAA